MKWMNSLKSICAKWVHTMADVKFDDFTIEVTNVIENRINAALIECAGELVSDTKKNSRVKTRETANSFRYEVDESAHKAYVGSDYENAIWEELGTGEYALHGNGRKGWRGKKPSRALYKSFVNGKAKIIKRLQNSLKGM